VDDALCSWVCAADPDDAEGGDEGGVDVRGVGGGKDGDLGGGAYGDAFCDVKSVFWRGSIQGGIS
jgi:hypothetical protein